MGKRFGDMTKDEQEAAIAKAVAQLQAELEANAPAISAWLNEDITEKGETQ